MEITKLVLQIVVIVATLGWMTVQALPRAGVSGLSNLGRLLVTGLWSAPSRKLGPLLTMTIYVAISAMLVSLVLVWRAVAGLGNQTHLLILSTIWSALAAGYLIVRAIARWRFRPKPLPRRR